MFSHMLILIGGNKMESSKGVEKKLEEMESQMEQLKKEQLEILVKEHKAFHCEKCEKVVVKEKASSAELEHTLCWDCLQRKQRKQHKDNLFSKIRQGRIVDIELDSSWYQNITRMTVYRQGMMYELRAVEDDGEAYFVIDKEWKEDTELDDEITKPWMKERTEKPLIQQ